MKNIVLSFVAAIVLMVGKSEVQGQIVTINPFTWHNQMSQEQRNAAIVRSAQSQYWVYHAGENGQCKRWVQNLVNWTCGVQVPPNANISVPWYWQMPAPYVSGGAPIVSGSIIQMKWVNKDGRVWPHTAIVESVTWPDKTITWLSCNFDQPNRVSRSVITWDRFTQAVGPYYTVYNIQ